MKQTVKPPKQPLRWLEHFCDPYLIEGITGDLEELYFENAENKGVRKARFIYWFQSLGFLRLVFSKKNRKITAMKSMWTNYLLTAYRSLKRHKVFFGINLTGLILAISCALYALLFITDEFRYDQHISGSENIYRLYKRHINVPEHTDELTYETSGMMGPTMTEEFPEITGFCRVLPWWDPMILSVGERHLSTQQVYFADSSFVDLFDVAITRGASSTLLKAPGTVIISDRLAKSLFGDTNPIGQTIKGLRDLDFTVEATFKAPPRRSSLQYDAVISWTSTVPGAGQYEQNWMNNWRAQGIFTFVTLAPYIQPNSLHTKLEGMMQTHFEERAENYFLKLQPFQEMYLYGAHILRARGMKTGSIQLVYLLGFSALLIFLIACVNYINITLSRSSQTHTEVGIRKALGSSKGQLMGRFISETFLTTAFATLISVVIIYLMIPPANALIGKDIPQTMLLDPVFLISIVAFIVGISLFLGTYPATAMAGHPISAILKSTSGTVKGTDWFRRVLLTLQYTISIFLVICTIATISQTRYLINRPLGFNKEQVLVVDINNEVGEKAEVLKTELLAHPNITAVSVGRSAIGGGSYSTRVSPENYNGDISARMFGIDVDFLKTYEIDLLHGRGFRKADENDSTTKLIVNRRFIEFLEWEDPLGKKITFSSGNTYPIVGVTEDFHISSLATTDIEPMIMFVNPRPEYASVRIGTGAITPTMTHVVDTYEQLATKTPLNYYFVDQWFQEQYESEQQMLEMSMLYAIISIILCALGLYGLTGLILQQRKKEISVRKVLGASMLNIVVMLNKEFMIMMGIAVMVATPLAYVLIDDWLAQFVYRIEIDFVPFALATVLTLVISLSIVSLLAFRTGNGNLSQNLNYE